MGTPRLAPPPASGAPAPPADPGTTNTGATATSSTLPTTPLGASPASPTPNPVLQSAMQQALQIVQLSRALAKQFPEAAPAASQINDAVRELMMKIAASQQPGEPAAPPIG